MKSRMYGRILRAACFLALLGIALMVWSLLVPTPMPVLVAMSVGQVLGTLSLVAFLFVVVADLRRARLDRDLAVSDPPNRPAP